jgi:hypothetical protein
MEEGKETRKRGGQDRPVAAFCGVALRPDDVVRSQPSDRFRTSSSVDCWLLIDPERSVIDGPPEYQHRGTEQQRHSNEDLFGYENWLKAMKGEHAALADPAFHAKLAEAERQLRANVAARPNWPPPTAPPGTASR